MMPRRDVIELWERRHEPNVAAAMLAIVEKYRAVGEPLPPLLARWHSQAIERMLNATPHAGQNPEHARWSEFGRALGMVKCDSRPTKFVSRFFVAMAIVNRESDYPAKSVRDAIMAEFSVCRNTADKAIDPAKAAINEGRRLLECALQRRQ